MNNARYIYCLIHIAIPYRYSRRWPSANCALVYVFILKANTFSTFWH